jgi:AraC-like DNA-binding protein
VAAAAAVRIYYGFYHQPASSTIRDMQQPIRDIHLIGPDTAEQISSPATRPALGGRGIGFVGLSDAGRGYRMHRIRPPFGHLLVTMGGMGRIWVHGQWSECGEGSAYISPPHALSAFETFPHRRWKFAWLFLEQTGGPPIGALSLDRSTLVPVDSKPLAIAIEGLYRESIGQADKTLFDHWAHLIHAYHLRIIQPSSSDRVDPLARLWADADARLAANWSLSSLAELAGMSGETLRKRCVAHHGRSPMQHLIHLRMRRADTLLQSTSAKLAVIARFVGYDNVFAFSTAFRRIYGVPPSQRRAKQSE